MDFGLLILFAAIVLFMVLAFKKVNAMLLAMIVSLFVLFAFQMPVLDSLYNYFMPATVNFVSGYFLIMLAGGIIGAIYQFTGAAESIAISVSKLARGKFNAAIVMVISGVLVYGGINGLGVYFVVYPIALQLFKRANISRILIPAAISAGTWTWALSAPGAPTTQNFVAMNYLGTYATAAFLPSMLVTIAEFAMVFIFLEWRAKILSKKGREFIDPSLTYQLTEEELAQKDAKDLPNVILTIIPLLLVIVLFNVVKIDLEISLFIGIISAIVLLINKLPTLDKWIEVLNYGGAGAVTGCFNTAIVVGFGGIVQNTETFSSLVTNFTNMNIPPLIFVAASVMFFAAICGSATGSLGIAFNAFTETYIRLGVNLEHVHRIAVISASTFDSLPHQGAQITLLNLTKITHKEGFFDIAITQILIPFITVGLFILLASLGL